VPKSRRMWIFIDHRHVNLSVIIKSVPLLPEGLVSFSVIAINVPSLRMLI
jgi:hypothetical protein